MVRVVSLKPIHGDAIVNLDVLRSCVESQKRQGNEEQKAGLHLGRKYEKNLNKEILGV